MLGSLENITHNQSYHMISNNNKQFLLYIQSSYVVCLMELRTSISSPPLYILPSLSPPSFLPIPSLLHLSLYLIFPTLLFSTLSSPSPSIPSSPPPSTPLPCTYHPPIQTMLQCYLSLTPPVMFPLSPSLSPPLPPGWRASGRAPERPGLMGAWRHSSLTRLRTGGKWEARRGRLAPIRENSGDRDFILGRMVHMQSAFYTIYLLG